MQMDTRLEKSEPNEEFFEEMFRTTRDFHLNLGGDREAAEHRASDAVNFWKTHWPDFSSSPRRTPRRRRS